MALTSVCERCGHVLGEEMPQAAMVTRFPDDVLGSFALLSHGVGAVVCPNCSQFATMPMHHIVVGAGGCVVVGVQTGLDPGNLLKQVEDWQQPEWKVHLARDPKAFRRLVVGELVQPYALLLNRFAAADEALDWVRDNEAALDARFFQAMWLAGSGALPIFTQEYRRGAEERAGFVPDEEAPDAARHVVRRQEALEVQHRTVGRLIGQLLALAAIRAMELRSLAPLTEQLPARVPAIILRDAVLASAAAVIASIVEGLSRQRTPGWIVTVYACEAALALICRAHGEENPRRREWTTHYLLYDTQRRIEGNDDVLLPPADAVRATLDAALFWQHYRGLGRQARAETDRALARQRLQALMETAAYAFPEEWEAQTHVEVHIDDGLDEQAARREARRLLTEALGPPANWTRLKSVITGLCRKRPAIAAELVFEIAGLGDSQLDVQVRLPLLRMAIEHLNANGQIEHTDDLFEAGMRLVQEEDSNDSTRLARGQFLNEAGNCLRLRHQPEAAVRCYQLALELIGGDVTDADQRVGQRNLAIVLRELHRYVEALAIFERLLPDAGAMELRGLVTSQAICLTEMGYGRQALELMERHVRYLAGVAVDERGAIEYATQLAFLRAQAGQLQQAHELMLGVREEALRRRYHAALLIGCDIELRLGVQDTETRRRLLDEQCDLLEALQGRSLGAAGLAALHHVDAALHEGGEADRAERLTRHLIDALDPAQEPRGWLLHRLAARHAERRGQAPTADLERALLDFQRGIAAAAANGDVRDFATPQSAEVGELVGAVLATASGDRRHDERLWRHAGDAAAAPVLTSRLRAAVRLLPAFEAADAEDRRLAEMLASPRAGALVQVVLAGAEIVFLRTQIDRQGRLATEVVAPGLKAAEAARIGRTLAFHLVRADPTATSLMLEGVRGWPAFAAHVRAGFAELARDRPTVVAAGPLQEAAIVLALDGERALSFVPSLAAATALHARRQTAPAAGERFRMFGFATWLDRERADEVRALASVAALLERLGVRFGVGVDNVSAELATRERLVDGLAACDVAWIACHGRLRREAETVELLVAADGRLAPAHAGSSVSGGDARHAVGWQALAALPRAPSLVLSSACDSGLALTNPGGERLGLERALLPAGTQAFVAPLWPVPTVSIQAVAGRLLEAWLAERDLPLAVHLHRIRKVSVDEGMPALAADALAVFGDLAA